MLCNLASDHTFCFSNLVTVAFEVTENGGPSWESMNLCASFSGLKLSLVLMMLLFYWPLSRRVILINFIFIQKDCIRLSLYFSDQQLLELLKANADWFFVNSVKKASICWFFKLFEPGRSCSKLVDQITGKTNEDQSCVNEFAAFLSRQFWSFIKRKTVQNKDKETIFNKFHNFLIDEDMLSQWLKMLKCLGILGLLNMFSRRLKQINYLKRFKLRKKWETIPQWKIIKHFWTTFAIKFSNKYQIQSILSTERR